MKSWWLRIATSAGTVVATPSTTSSSSARSIRFRAVSRSAPDTDELADEVVVVLADLVAARVATVEPHSEAVGDDELGDLARRRQEPAACGVLGVDAALDRVASPLDRRLVEGERQSGGHSDLLGDEVDAGDHLGDRMLDLKSRVHLEEVELAVGVQELDGAGVVVADRARHRDGGFAHCAACLFGEQGSGALLDELLVAALRRAVALTEPDHVAVGVADDLDFDVPRPGQVALDVELGPPEVRLGLACRGLDGGLDPVCSW